MCIQLGLQYDEAESRAFADFPVSVSKSLLRGATVTPPCRGLWPGGQRGPHRAKGQGIVGLKCEEKIRLLGTSYNPACL